MVDIFNRFGINAAPETVYAAIEGLKDWFLTDHAGKRNGVDMFVFCMDGARCVVLERECLEEATIDAQLDPPRLGLASA